LIVGGGDVGVGADRLLARSDLDVIETDVYFGPRTKLICDGHDLPFADGSFDGVVCQAVLEHVADPNRVASEIARVLAPQGVVYSEVPFMQQVHEGAYDFTRFTHVGHRLLFRHFDELHSGIVGGPGMALGWSVRYFAMAPFSRPTRLRKLAGVLAGALVSWLKYLDAPLSRRPGALDGASGTFFLGRKRETPLSVGECVAAYRGAAPTPVRY
jgi:SAM-dependent methyltransferase